MNKPVAWMFEYGTDRGDAVNGISWYPNVHFKKPDLGGLIRNIEPLYTHPVKELNDGGEPVKNATYWKRQYNLMASQNDNLKSGLYHANEQIKFLEGQLEVADQLTKMRLTNSANKVKELTLTDDEIDNVWAACSTGESDTIDMHLFAEAILRKAQEK